MGDSSKRSGGSKTSPGEFPLRGRLMGVDYGSKRVGLALSNPDQTLATPLETLERRDERQDARRLQQVVKEYTVVGLIVGLPVHMSGDEGAKAREARAWGEWAGKAAGLPVRFHDERYTTAMADELLAALELSAKQKKERRDRLAAQILLQSYLDSHRDNQSPGALAD